jgi:mono/diheme cytochrome c family protein
MAAAYSGVLTITEPGRYRFGTQVQGGTARVSVFDKSGKRAGQSENAGDPRGQWTEWADLTPGPVTVSVQFTRDGGGASRLRTLWERAGSLDQGGFPAEPIPASAVVAPVFSQRDSVAAASEFRGRVLMGELNCTGCHSAGPESEAVLTARAAPMLGEIGRRARPEWLLAWISDPQKIKPGCGMPGVLGDSSQDRADAAAIVQFLASLGSSGESGAAPDAGTMDLGRRLFHTVGCVACHGPLEAPAAVFKGESQSAALPEVHAPHAFGNLAGKWRAGPLAEFLKDPLKSHPAGRMPSMSLTDNEAGAIAAYLCKTWGEGSWPAFIVDATKAETGKAAFAARGCASCHQLGGKAGAVAPTLKAKPLSALTAGAGCMSANDKASPRYGLSAQDRTDLAAAMEAVKRVTAGGKPSAAPLDEGERLVAAFGCLNCHSKDEVGGPADAERVYFRTVDETELGDEGRLPPRLTGVGNKLTPTWIREVLTNGGKARPYMATRMPQFGKLNVGRLHTMLVAMDGATMEVDRSIEPKLSDEGVLDGRRLVGENGLNCISCHAYSGRTAGTAGPDITAFADRLRYDWWKSYVLAPARYKPGTRMSAFYSSGRGRVQDVYDGDPDKQTDAIWAYFGSCRTWPPPRGVPASDQGLPIAIGDRPVVFRTFMKDQVYRGIAVGYPAGVHCRFDATAVRMVDAWEGDFLDASGAWRARAGEVAGGQGKTVWTAPAGPALVIGSKPEKWPEATGQDAGFKFHGYKIEKDGVPTFLYSLTEEGATVEVTERFVPKPRAGVLIAREFTVSGVPAGRTLWVNGGAGMCNLVSAGSEKRETAGEPGKAAWFGVTPAGSAAMSFTLEITP